MAFDLQLPNEATREEDDLTVLPRRPMEEVGEMDITPMIDITFLLLIFFIVAAKMADSGLASLPEARHGVGVPSQDCVVLTIALDGPQGARIYLGQGSAEVELTGGEEQQALAIEREIEAARNAGRHDVLIRADAAVMRRHVSRIDTAAARVDGISIYYAVLGKE
jgi:biopolymer transport protein TolR